MTFYRYLLVGLVLCGCAWGQAVQVQTHSGCDPLPDGTHGKSGNDCYLWGPGTTVRTLPYVTFADICYNEGTTLVCPNLIVPDAPVVPAIRERRRVATGYVEHCLIGGCMVGMGTRTPTYSMKNVWTCVDKSRVLLTTEEGKKICVKF
jgi:hypothetical protein